MKKFCFCLLTIAAGALSFGTQNAIAGGNYEMRIAYNVQPTQVTMNVYGKNISPAVSVMQFDMQSTKGALISPVVVADRVGSAAGTSILPDSCFPMAGPPVDSATNSGIETWSFVVVCFPGDFHVDNSDQLLFSAVFNKSKKNDVTYSSGNLSYGGGLNFSTAAETDPVGHNVCDSAKGSGGVSW